MSIDVDISRSDQNAEIAARTTLFRLASLLYSSKADLLTGQGAIGAEGRYHRIHQATSYASDNVYLCLAEILYHMSRNAMNYLANKGNPSKWRQHAQQMRHLVIFEVNKVSDLIYIDTDDAGQEISLHAGQVIPSTIIVHPDCVYYPLHAASDHYRKQKKTGIVYPSARHSKDLAVALFLDQSKAITNIIATLTLTLTLVEEGTGKLAIPHGFDPNLQKISHTQGHYEFDINDYTTHSRLLKPPLAVSNHIEFVR